MIREISRSEFLAAPDTFEHGPCLALAAVVGASQSEAAVLEGWSALCARLTGTGARVGSRAFVALVQDSELTARRAIAAFSEHEAAHTSWCFVAAPASALCNPLPALKEVEWRAHKGGPGQGAAALSVIEAPSVL